ncbi:TonB-dependent receptor domain-containing protein [Flavobacterium rhizosphaerae]|uniref:Outer membrane beta-barrel family protein n=1 Tax=Flavobacterium rhizosphaerae TaxID=3163298 RepID=A0ABW8YVR7_9FLAO
MRRFQTFVLLTFLFSAVTGFAQNNNGKKATVTGKVIEQDTKLPLEFATVTLLNPGDNSTVTGGMTNGEGVYTVTVDPGTYIFKYDFISFQSVQVTKQVTGDANLGTTPMAPDATLLNEVEITAERSTVDIQLDKRVYTVGNDMMVKGGTVSDVLDNVPSISVDAEGNVALRGNQSVTILIDGRPSNLAGSNIADVLRLLPADSVDKVEVITNPSARYDAEGGGGIINIILKKGKADGFNGSVTATTGQPDNHGLMANLNYRSENYNVFSNLAYNYRKSPGMSFTNSEYLDENGNTTQYVNEDSDRERLRRGVNANFGIDWYLTKTLSWTNAINFRRSNGDNPTKTYYDYYLADKTFNYTRFRYNLEDEKDTNVNYSSYFLKKFNDDGHQLKVDVSVAKSIDDENSYISDEIVGSTDPDTNSYQQTLNKENEDRAVVQADYVLPFSEESRFEAGYRGSFTTLDTDFDVQDLQDGAWIDNDNYTYHLIYKEKVNALYAQYGSKYGKFSYMAGMRWEDSNIDVNLLNANDYNKKRYNNFFPSAFLNYEFSENSNVTLSYSRRINRPRGRFLNPFGGLQSNINIFRGNPDLNPAMTNAFDLGYMRKWNTLTFSTSAYLNVTDNTFQFVRTRQGETADGTPITVTSPINLAQEYRFGFEFNINYNPFKWWRINSNFNFFRNETKGDYTFNYTYNGQQLEDYQDFNNVAYSWFTRINSKITLPWKIDWQVNADYRGAETNAQGKRRGVASMNTALSKDILKDKATIAVNVQDVFNSRKWKNEVYLPGELRSYGEMQWRKRQITLSFTYRFNMRRDNQKEQQRDGQGQPDSEDYIGG